jgi:ABC-type transport system substrate-binding protein
MFRSYFSLTILVSSVVLFSCYNSEKRSENIFHYNEQTGIASIDPAFAKNQSVMWAVHQLYNTLVEVDSQLNIIPSLAKGWKISDDKRVYTFYLRNDVVFHDDECFSNGKGRRMTAKDVEYSFKRIVDQTTASPGSWIFNNKIDDIDGFKSN